MSRSFSLISGAFVLRSRAFALSGHVVFSSFATRPARGEQQSTFEK
jgi:hypothetical protein